MRSWIVCSAPPPTTGRQTSTSCSSTASRSRSCLTPVATEHRSTPFSRGSARPKRTAPLRCLRSRQHARRRDLRVQGQRRRYGNAARGHRGRRAIGPRRWCDDAAGDRRWQERDDRVGGNGRQRYGVDPRTRRRRVCRACRRRDARGSLPPGTAVARHTTPRARVRNRAVSETWEGSIRARLRRAPRAGGAARRSPRTSDGPGTARRAGGRPGVAAIGSGPAGRSPKCPAG